MFIQLFFNLIIKYVICDGAGELFTIKHKTPSSLYEKRGFFNRSILPSHNVKGFMNLNPLHV